MLTVLRGVDVLAPEPRGTMDVLVAGERIAAMAPALDLGPAVGAVEVDGRGLTAIPGLVDAHVHVTGGGGEAGPETRMPPIALSTLALAGVTSVVGLLGTDTTTRTMRSLVARTLGLRAEGLSAWCWTGGYEVPPRTLTGSVRDDIVFVDPILGVGEVAVSDHRSSQPTFDELVRVAADARVAGLLSGKAGVVHLHLGDGPRGLSLVRRALEETELPARTFHPTHVNRRRALFGEALELAARGVTVDVTAFPVAEGEDAYTADEALWRYREAGLPAERVTCSSDGAGCLPVFDASGRLVEMDVGSPAVLLEALSALVARGVPLSEALLPFTENPARLLGLTRKGRLAPGQDADMVFLDAAGRVRDVMARGQYLVREGRAVVRGVFERGPA